MVRLLACLMTGSMLLAAPGLALGQATQGVSVSAPVVIAPPQSEVARIIKRALSGDYYAAPRDSQSYWAAQQLYFFYGGRHFEPIWLEEVEDGSVALSDAAKDILALFRDAEADGLRPADYLTPTIDLSSVASEPTALAAFEMAFSATAMRYARDNATGRIDPRSVSSVIDITRRRLDESALLVELASSEDPGAMLRELAPDHPEFVALRAALNRILDGEITETITIPEGALVRPGMIEERVPLMRERLGVDAPAKEDMVYDEALVAAVMQFQESLSLDPDGVTGPATVAALNGGTSTSIEDILANMERWRWMPEDLGEFNVLVNIPEYRLWIQREGEAVYTTRVVVGKPTNKTPVFSDEIEHIVVNPYWNVPSSIANNEIAPRLISNPSYIDSQNMELLYGGQVISAYMVDWTVTSIDNFRIRQRPGAGNALGQVKFLFPNQHDVYLHDTPSKALFEHSYRAYSHGCVRVQNPMDFADALLELEPVITRASLESRVGGEEHWNNLENHVPVHLTYFTLRVDEDGTIRSYGDVYGHNARLIELMAI